MDEEGHVKKIYTYSTKTLPLTLKFNDTINIQLQNVNVQGTLTDIQTKTLIRVTKYFICKCLRHSLFLVFRNLLVFFSSSSFFFYVHHWHDGEKHCGVCPYQCTAYWIQLFLNLFAKKTASSHPEEPSEHMWRSSSCPKDSCKDGHILNHVRVTLWRPW